MWRRLVLSRPLVHRQSLRGVSSVRRVPPTETLAALRSLLGDRLSTSPAVLEQHGRDESYHTPVAPDAVAFVESTEEVSEVIKICAATATPVIPFGAGSSIEGQIPAKEGGVSIDMSSMNQILQVEPENLSCRVQAGVTRMQLNAELRATGLFFPVDPGADATIGGMIATNASGTTTVRYGNMKTAVMALTVVTPDGRIIKTGSKTRKSSAGYDLARLLIGSEGTLAVVTEAELRLCGIPEAEKTMICTFPSIQAAVDTCTAVMQMGIPVARMELMDENSVEAVNKFCQLNNQLRPTLIIEHHGSPNDIEEQSAVVQEIARESGVQDIELASTPEGRKKLWRGRHSVWHAILAQHPGCNGFSADVAVPFSRLAAVIVETQEDMKQSGLVGPIVGHVGDANFHVLLPIILGDAELMGKVKAFVDRLVCRALLADGTCTGEHGIGAGKMDYLVLEHGEGGVAVMRAIKDALDPRNIMNPGKILYGKPRADASSLPDDQAMTVATRDEQVAM